MLLILGYCVNLVRLGSSPESQATKPGLITEQYHQQTLKAYKDSINDLKEKLDDSQTLQWACEKELKAFQEIKVPVKKK